VPLLDGVHGWLLVDALGSGDSDLVRAEGPEEGNHVVAAVELDKLLNNGDGAHEDCPDTGYINQAVESGEAGVTRASGASIRSRRLAGVRAIDPAQAEGLRMWERAGAKDAAQAEGLRMRLLKTLRVLSQ